MNEANPYITYFETGYIANFDANMMNINQRIYFLPGRLILAIMVVTFAPQINQIRNDESCN